MWHIKSFVYRFAALAMRELNKAAIFSLTSCAIIRNGIICKFMPIK